MKSRQFHILNGGNEDMADAHDKIRNKIVVLMSILGESLFYQILDFFVELMQSKEEYKILMTRRLFDLYGVFREIIDFLYKGAVKQRGNIVTNISIVLWENKLKDADILLIDDILLHGRSLDGEYRYLKDFCGCSADRISARVLIQNIDKRLIESDLLERLDAKEKVDDSTWRILSGKIVNAFLAAGQPYISYVPYAEFGLGTPEGKSLQAFTGNQEQVEDITTVMQEYLGIRAFLYCVGDRAYDGNLGITQARMIRIYVLERLEKVILTPYNYLRPFKKEKLESVFQEIEGLDYFQYDGNIKKVQDSWLPGNIHAHDRFMYSAMTYLTSMALGNEFMESIGITHAVWKEDISALGFKSAECLKGNERELIGCLKSLGSGFIATGREEPTQDIRKAAAKVKSAKDSLSQFVRECGIQDEERADRNQARMKGVSIGTLCDLFKIDAVKTIWCKVISLADAGKITIMVSPDVIDGQDSVGSLVVAGEQNPTCNEENRAALVLPLIEFKDFCAVNNRDFSQLKGKLIEQICQRYPEIQENLMPDEWEEAVGREVIQYREYYLDRLPVYENNSILKGALNVEVQYENTL